MGGQTAKRDGGGVVGVDSHMVYEKIRVGDQRSVTFRIKYTTYITSNYIYDYTIITHEGKPFNSMCCTLYALRVMHVPDGWLWLWRVLWWSLGRCAYATVWGWFLILNCSVGGRIYKYILVNPFPMQKVV